MRHSRTMVVCLVLGLSALLSAGCPPVPDAKLHFFNDSTDDFVRGIYLQEVGDTEESENLIKAEILPGESFVLKNLYPGTYTIHIAVRTTEGWYYGYIPSETFDLVSGATLEGHYARGFWEAGPLVY